MSKERKPHKHAEAIKAWADGAMIETKSLYDDGWYYIGNPGWNDGQQYRVKPEPVKMRYRVFAARRIHDGGIITMTVDSSEQERHFSSLTTFIRWLTDWIEVEVPQ